MSTDTSPQVPATAQPRRFREFFASRDGVIATAALIAIVVYLILHFAFGLEGVAASWPLVVIVMGGGIPLGVDVVKSAIVTRGGADTLAAVSIIASVLMGEWLVAAIVVLMLSGGEALEEAASKRASATLDALARRAPQIAHRRLPAGSTEDIAIAEVRVGDELVVLPHELCPVDGEVISGHGAMDESYLTGEPYVVSKSEGSEVISGAINADDALVIRATALAEESRYETIVGVLRDAETNRPQMRRMADRLGAWYTVLALVMGALGWIISGDPTRFLAVVVIATPCPLLIGVPVAIIGAINLAAKRGIIIKNPGILEEVSTVDTVMFDKTGTLTYGRPVITHLQTAAEWEEDYALALAAAIERYSRHPLATAIVDEAEARGVEALPVTSISEKPGQGLSGVVDGHQIMLTNRKGLSDSSFLPQDQAGMESVMLIDGKFAAFIQFRDEPRAVAKDFIAHLARKHGTTEIMIISGDRASETEYLADKVGISTVHAGVSPEGKLALVREFNERGSTLFLGDGINDAPAMAAATVGVAFGTGSDVTMEAADAVVLDSSLERLDNLLHIGKRMRRIALQSVIGGMALSFLGMVLAVFGILTPLMGAIAQEVIDILAILNAARVPFTKKELTDF
ncbi:heavy metal translocating P-type ATPase [uncultured Corynebacterium sp.]|uniref:heavy metal translocating P-type ATPase n=1 Tax=uncultured Corynebacterium sp. TaxID=159447 RepID=UPI0025E60DD6|nr:heavy metal translocating P-type ATPase [uncultured Corynebacterium sp.]